MSKLYIKRKYGQTPNELLNRDDISLKAKGLFGFLQSKPSGWNFSELRIIRQLKEGRDAIRTTIKELQKHGYLRKTPNKDKRGRWNGWNYELLESPLCGKSSQRITQSADNPDSPSKKESSKKENSKKEKPISVFFEKFWNSYPKKKSKPAALKALKKLNPSQSLLDTILKDIETKKQSEEWIKQNGQFIPYPATYLNQRRWEDEDEQSSGWRYM